VARTSKPRKQYKPREILVACRSAYGHLKIGIEAISAPDKFNVYIEDARVNKRARRSAEFQGSARDALAVAIEMAKNYLESRGEDSEHETAWHCNNVQTLEPVPTPRITNGSN
jgi:hypothetical protein